MMARGVNPGSTAEAPAVKARLLIVDDEPTQMRALCDTLEFEGYATHGCASAREALAAFAPGRFDLLLTDLVLPDMDGIALSNAIRDIDPSLAVIVMTGHGSIDTAVRAIQDGALDYVLKPLKLDVVLGAMTRALEMRRLRREYARIQALEQQRSAELALANRDLESYAYSISHDLRAPLRAVSSFAQILEEDHGECFDPEAKRLIGIVRSGCRTMDQLIVGLLEFSRATNETRRLSMDIVDMTVLADAAAREMAMNYRHPQPAIEIGDLPSVLGDATVLRQVWCNLIGNALKYSTKNPAPRVTITGREEGPEAIYQVCDNGVGFDPRYAEKLFGVFQRLHRAEDFPGVGVGLAIVQRIVVRHGGRIWAQSVLGEGASFHFALPVTPRASGETDS